MFADDIVILSRSSKGLQKCLNVLEEYCRKWKMNINIKNTKIMFNARKTSDITSFLMGKNKTDRYTY